MTTEIIITELNNAVIIEKKEPVVVSSQSQTKVVVGGMIGPTPTRLAGLHDLDLTQLSAGSLLVYNAGTEKWHATNLLDQQVFEAGQF
jgi:hypothetical protein